MTKPCIRQERIANEILMHFRSQKKSSTDVSLSDYIETGGDGGALQLMDVICAEDDLFEDLSSKQLHGQLREAMRRCLTPREEEILRLRYGLDCPKPLPQREVAACCGISRSYVSRIEKRALEKLQQELEGGV